MLVLKLISILHIHLLFILEINEFEICPKKAPNSYNFVDPLLLLYNLF